MEIAAFHILIKKGGSFFFRTFTKHIDFYQKRIINSEPLVSFMKEGYALWSSNMVHCRLKASEGKARTENFRHYENNHRAPRNSKFGSSKAVGWGRWAYFASSSGYTACLTRWKPLTERHFEFQNRCWNHVGENKLKVVHFRWTYWSEKKMAHAINIHNKLSICDCVCVILSW